MNEVVEIEPNFEFCWALSWRLLLLSSLIGIMPFATAAICFGIAGRAIPAPFNYIALIGSLLIVMVASLAFALKILLSKEFRGAAIRFHPSNA
jgi:hypothetical protein